MKKRITLTIDPAVAKHAKKAARARDTSVSGLVEELLRSASIPGGERRDLFADRWAGKFMVAEDSPDDQRMLFLKTKHGLLDR